MQSADEVAIVSCETVVLTPRDRVSSSSVYVRSHGQTHTLLPDSNGFLSARQIGRRDSPVWKSDGLDGELDGGAAV